MLTLHPFPFLSRSLPLFIAGRTALHWCTVATGKGHKAAQTLIKAFKDKGINPSPVDGDKMTPLHWASFHNNAKCCELLLKGGAKVRL